MRILQICGKAPFGRRDGHEVAMFAITEGLASAGHSVKVLFFNTSKHPFDTVTLDAETQQKYSPEGVYIDNRVKAIPAFLNLFTNKSYNISRFETKAFARRLKEVLSAEKFDAVILETIVPAVYLPVIRQCTDAKIILRQHNYETLIWERRAAEESNPIKRQYLKLLARRLGQFERAVLSEVDAIAAISDTDREHFLSAGTKAPVHTIPIGLDLPEYSEIDKKTDFSLFFLGTMDWSANLDGLLWFLEDIWPLLAEAYPELKFHIAGRKIAEYAHLFKGPNLVIDGEVPSARDYILSQGIMVVPLRYGSGTRVKIIEAMALGKPIIATTIGAEGIAAEPGKEIMIADSAARFIEQLGKCNANPAHTARLGRAAAEFARKNFDRTEITKKLVELLRK